MEDYDNIGKVISGGEAEDVRQLLDGEISIEDLKEVLEELVKYEYIEVPDED